VAVCACMFGTSAAWGQFGRGGGMGGRRGGGGSGERTESSQSQKFHPPATQGVLTPHGGQYLTTANNYYEVVVMPLQTRVYLYDNTVKPLSARDVHVQMSILPPGESRIGPIPLQYVATPPEVADQDYVAVNVDVTRLPDKETPFTFEFTDLPDRHHRTESFSPLFSPAKIRPYVAHVLLTEADRDAVARQRVCPVSGTVLGSTGQVVKLLIGDYPLYVADERCIAAVRQGPERYLPQPQPIVGR
jgi:hypothetical protein